MEPFNALFFIFVLRVANGSFYKKDGRFNLMSTSGYDMMEFSFARRLKCAGLCDCNKNCTAFIHNCHDGRCQLLSQMFNSSQGKRSQHGNAIYRRIGVCKVPSIIPNGRLLSFDGQFEGSQAWFICEDFHFTNISHGICRPDGVWEGLDKPCVHVDKSPYVIESKDRIIPGRCVIILATTHHNKQWPRVVFSAKARETEQMLHISFRFDENAIVRNNIINGKWGTEERQSPRWPLEHGREANITVCIEEACYRGFVDGVEMFTFKHRTPVNDIELLSIVHVHVRRLTFTDWRL